MNMNLKLGVVALFCVGLIGGAFAQNKPRKSSSRSSTIHHAPVRRKSSGVAMPDNSKKLNSDLAKLETQTSRAVRPTRSGAKEKAVRAPKAFSQQDRRSNPPINFSYSGKGSGSASHTGGASHSNGTPAKVTPRMR